MLLCHFQMTIAIKFTRWSYLISAKMLLFTLLRCTVNFDLTLFCFALALIRIKLIHSLPIAFCFLCYHALARLSAHLASQLAS